MSDPYIFADLQPHNSDNMGGAWRLRYALVEWVTSSPPPVQGVCTTDLTFDPANDEGEWHELQFTPDTGDLQEDVVLGPNGSQYTHRFTCVIALVDIFRLRQLQMVQRHRLIAEVQDGNGLWRRLGDLRNPARASFADGTGAGASARNSATLTITWLNDEPAPFVDSTYTPDFSHLESSTSGSGGGPP